MLAAFFIAAARLAPDLRDERIRLETRCLLVAILYIMYIKKYFQDDKNNKIIIIIK